MKETNNILEQFENLRTIEVSSDWNNQFYERLNRSKKASPLTMPKIILVTTLMLIAVNVFSISSNLLQVKKHQSETNFKSIASEILISTSSSKY